MAPIKRMTILSFVSLYLLMATACQAQLYKDSISMSLLGEPSVVINYGNHYIDEGVVVLDDGKDVSEEVIVTDDVDFDMLGTYHISYVYHDHTIEREIIIKDTDPPEIVLNGSAEIFIPLDETYADPACICVDNLDGDITDHITTTSDLDVSKQGDYTVIYSATDENGNTATAQRLIHVVTSPLSFSTAEFNLDNLFEDTILKETILSEEELATYLEDTYFIGDSRNCWFLWKDCVDAKHVWGVKSLDPLNIDKLKIELFYTGEKALAIDMIEKYQPKRVIFTMGVDAVGAVPPDEIVAHYKAFLLDVMEKAPETQIIVHNIMPVAAYMDTLDTRPWAPTNKKINDANYFIVRMCEELDIPFLYTAPILKDENGLGYDQYYYNDHIHLTSTAQQMVYEYIITHPYLDGN